MSCALRCYFCKIARLSGLRASRLRNCVPYVNVVSALYICQRARQLRSSAALLARDETEAWARHLYAGECARRTASIMSAAVANGEASRVVQRPNVLIRSSGLESQSEVEEASATDRNGNERIAPRYNAESDPARFFCSSLYLCFPVSFIVLLCVFSGTLAGAVVSWQQYEVSFLCRGKVICVYTYVCGNECAR